MTAPPPIVLLCAVPQELKPIARALLLRRTAAPGLEGYAVYAGPLDKRGVYALPCGMGARRAEQAVDGIAATLSPRLLIITGVAGALHLVLQIGDLVSADAVIAGDELLTPDVVLEHSGSHPTMRRGRLLSLDRVLVTAEQKAAARAETHALAVEMETAGAIRAARRHGIPWAALRAISDTAGEGLSLDFNALRDADGDLRTSRVGMAALRHPASIPGLLRLGRNTAAAADALALCLQTLMPGLPLAPASESTEPAPG